MSVFGVYSRCYNLLYRDKDYTGEAGYIQRLIQRHLPGAGSLLDLGCGTGRHDLLLANMGYAVTGIDQSEEMLSVARSQPSPCSFLRVDISTVRLERAFDVVVSLFHVMSYQTGNEDLDSVFATACAHLKPGGIFIFDCWYGPEVLRDRPAGRVKRLEDEAISVTRIADPVMHPNENLVAVNYHVFVRDKVSREVEEVRETHRMRYLFRPKIECFARQAGISIIDASEWMTSRVPGFDTWGVCFVSTNQLRKES